MPTPEALLSTIAPDATLEQRQELLGPCWRVWLPGAPPLRWEDFLLPPGQPCLADFVCDLLEIDVEFRVKRGLPALLASPYFQVALDAAQAGASRASAVGGGARVFPGHARSVASPGRWPERGAGGGRSGG